MTRSSLRVGVDVGGTFTDAVAEDLVTGRITTFKTSTTSPDPSIGVMLALASVLEACHAVPADVSSVIHSTTIVANAIIERKGARTALVTTDGFRDVLETGTEKRYDVYDFNARLPEPLVPRRLRVGVPERLDERGAVVTAFDTGRAEAVAAWLQEQGVESVAVCFLHAYQDGRHERAMEEVLARVAPQVDVSLSSRVAPQIREYPRFSTTAADAYVRPIVRRYVLETERTMNELGFSEHRYMMVSGAIVTSGVAVEAPIRLIDSGPSAAAMAAGFYATLTGRSSVVSLEMGGTTAKIGFVDGGTPSYTNEFDVARVDRFRKGSGLPIALPAVDLVEIGAGGGSIAWLDPMGLLRVGPQSAGSDPGPVCYARGGTQPTLTDANLMLGYLDGGSFLDGRMSLDGPAAAAAVTEVGSKLGLDPLATAWGIHQSVTENMIGAAREYIAEKGRDVRASSLFVAGGAGPQHAVAIARKLGIREVLVPWGAGVASAVGSLASPIGFDFVQTHITRLFAADPGQVEELLQALESRARQLLGQAGVPPGAMELTRSCDMRYVGQTHEIRVALPEVAVDGDALQGIADAYADEYARRYNHPNVGYEIECINWRVFARGPRPTLQLADVPAIAGSSLDAARRGRRPASFDGRSLADCDVFDHALLFEGACIEGPAIIEDAGSTVVLPAGAVAYADRHLDLLVTP